MRNLPLLLLALAANGVLAAPVKTEKFSVSVPQQAPAGERLLAPQKLLVKVAATGDVVDLRYRSESPAPIRDLVARAVRQWKFSPHLVNGQPVEWVTGLSVGLNAVPLDDKEHYGLKITRAVINSSLSPGITPPRYPSDMQRAHRAALVCVDVRLGADGKLAIVGEPLVNGAPPRKGDPFLAAVREAAKSWTAQAIDFDGVPYPGDEVSRIPVTFLPDEGKHEIPTACPPRDGASNGSMRLLTNPVGTML